MEALALQPSHAGHVSARHESVVRYMQVYMDSINDLLWEEQGSGAARPKLEVRIGAFGSHLPGLVEKQVCLTAFLTAPECNALPCWLVVVVVAAVVAVVVLIVVVASGLLPIWLTSPYR